MSIMAVFCKYGPNLYDKLIIAKCQPTDVIQAVAVKPKLLG
jgi:hypothetical protein